MSDWLWPLEDLGREDALADLGDDARLAEVRLVLRARALQRLDEEVERLVDHHELVLVHAAQHLRVLGDEHEKLNDLEEEVDLLLVVLQQLAALLQTRLQL